MGKLRWKADSKNICSGRRHARFSMYTKNEQASLPAMRLSFKHYT